MVKATNLRKYKILKHCIACTTCSTVSPSVFKLDVKNQTAVVFNQPNHLLDDKKSFTALKSCPVSAIGVTNE